MNFRTSDRSYGKDYWDSLDEGRGYQDSTMWEDLAHIVKETFCIDRVEGRDASGEWNVLDVGAASGYLVRHLRRRGVNAWGADLSQYAIDQAPDDIRPFLRQHDLTNPVLGVTLLPDAPYRLITCFETMEHIAEEYVAQSLSHMYEALVPGGQILLTICTVDQPGWDTDPTHVCIKPRSWWHDQLIAVGFEVDDSAANFVRQFWLFSQHDGVFVVGRPF